jgi:hypothetical protein
MYDTGAKNISEISIAIALLFYYFQLM